MTYWNNEGKKDKSHEKAEGMRVLCGAVALHMMHGKKQERAHGGCLWLRKATKDVASCEKLRVGAGDR